MMNLQLLVFCSTHLWGSVLMIQLHEVREKFLCASDNLFLCNSTEQNLLSLEVCECIVLDMVSQVPGSREAIGLPSGYSESQKELFEDLLKQRSDLIAKVNFRAISFKLVANLYDISMFKTLALFCHMGNMYIHCKHTPPLTNHQLSPLELMKF